MDVIIVDVSNTEKYAIFASKYATVTVHKLDNTILGNSFSGWIISSMRKFKSAQPSKLHKHAIIAEKKFVKPLVPWKDRLGDKFEIETVESVDAYSIATINKTRTKSNFKDVNNLCNLADSLIPAQLSNAKKIIQHTAAIFAIGVSKRSELTTVSDSSEGLKVIPRKTDSKYLPKTVAIMACSEVELLLMSHGCSKSKWLVHNLAEIQIRTELGRTHNVNIVSCRPLQWGTPHCITKFKMLAVMLQVITINNLSTLPYLRASFRNEKIKPCKRECSLWTICSTKIVKISSFKEL